MQRVAAKVEQRAATERAFPNMWEVPGGASETTDPTVLHSLAREVFEETGLHLTRVVRQVGKGIEFTSRSKVISEDGGEKPLKVYLKLTFEIEVAEFEPQGPNFRALSRCHDEKPNIEEGSLETASLGVSRIDPPGFAPSSAPSIIITLDPDEHQRYDWVTEETYNSRDPLCTYPTTTETQRETILQAFALKIQSLTSQ